MEHLMFILASLYSSFRACQNLILSGVASMFVFVHYHNQQVNALVIQLQAFRGTWPCVGPGL